MGDSQEIGMLFAFLDVTLICTEFTESVRLGLPESHLGGHRKTPQEFTQPLESFFGNFCTNIT